MERSVPCGVVGAGSRERPCMQAGPLHAHAWLQLRLQTTPPPQGAAAVMATASTHPPCEGGGGG